MRSWSNKAKRWISHIIIYALLCGVLQSYDVGQASASTNMQLYRAGTHYLADNYTATQAGIVIEGQERGIVVTGSAFSLIDPTQEGNVAEESGVVATGAVMELLSGISGNFAIGETGAPVLYKFQTSRQLGNCQQFRIITTATQGFDAWLLNASLTPISMVTGLGGSNVWRQSLTDYTTYYILINGVAGTSGKLLCSDVLDDYGADFSSSSVVSLNKDYSIETEISGDVDMLRFTTATAVSTYRIRIESVVGSGGNFEIYDKNKRKIAQYSGNMGTSTINMAFTPVAGAVYYFRFTSGQTGRKILFHVTQTTTRYTVTYRLNGGKNAKANPTSYISTTPKFRLQNPTRSKYLFYGWYADSKFRTRVYYIQGQSRRNIVLYAKWVKVSPKAASIKTVKSKKVKQATVKWSKASGVKGYQLVYGTTRSLKKNVKKKITTKTSLTIKGLKPGKIYYFKICTYSKDSKGKKIYSKYSKIKKIRVKEKKKTKKKTATKKTTTTKKKTATKKTTAAKKKTTTKKTSTTKK